MQKLRFGNSDLQVSQLGLGCMGMSEFYGSFNDEKSLKVLEFAVDNGINFFDTADIYGLGKNETLIGKFLKSNRDKVIIATKFGVVRGEDGSFLGVNGKPEYIKQACEMSLQRLGIDCIDLYYQHRVDSNTPAEESIGAMSRLVSEG